MAPGVSAIVGTLNSPMALAHSMGVALGEEFGGLGGVNVLKDTLKVQMDVKFVGLVVLLLVDSVLIFVE